MGIKEQFDKISHNYDKQRRLFIPCFDDYYHLPLEMLEQDVGPLEILDIGSGTGLFSSILLQKYPNAHFTLIDVSDKMLSVAKERFSGSKRFEYILADYTQYTFNKKFDIIISALSIHHLDAANKKSLYHNCFQWLNTNGIFINVDQALSPSPEIEKQFSDIWKGHVEKGGLSPEEIQAAYERVRLDNPSTLEEQMRWLREAGFPHVDILYKYFHFCVFYAKK
ncbi:MAG: class I SAM-dependent methyltransferase [Defluviitaleaceae bacterium]|nr:class I SAM-dependent methyltransferase [Defluviitaleaceae bacterium]